MSDNEQKTDSLPQRLCSEIQLFDLCDLDTCRKKSGRYCTDSILIDRFEKIREEEFRVPEHFDSEETDDMDDMDGDDDFEMEDYEGGEADNWEDEE